ncbi:MAG: SDR family NAD(P)-dependent oxidoreductase [Lachnospiraceae bacterium]|nr:SDR family NAD(P)-dependent oxidoreductase [Lachnospiraceae bacterium]
MKTLLITGASRGIGRQTAIELAKDYDYIAICSKSNIDMLEDTKSIIESRGCKCRCFTGDVANYDFVSNMVSSIIEDTGTITTLINNAGIASIGLFTDTTPNNWSHIINTNLTSVYNTCHLVVPYMVRSKQGQIINISSVWGLTGASCEVAYSATKGAINSFTKALAKELAPSNISVNAVAFGAIDTDMNKELTSDDIAALNEEIPFGRMASPTEAALCIKNLLAMPTYLTGEVIKFDGAWI